MRTTNASSKALQQGANATSSSLSSSPESKTTAYSYKSCLNQKIFEEKQILRKKVEMYSKINKARSNLLLLSSSDVSKKQNLFFQDETYSSFIIRQESDLISNTSNHNECSYFKEIEHSYIDYSSPVQSRYQSISPQKRPSFDIRKCSSKQLCLDLFLVRRHSKIIESNCKLTEKKPFYEKLSVISESLKNSKRTGISNINKLDDLEMLASMIKSSPEKVSEGTKSLVIKKKKTNSFQSNIYTSESNIRGSNYRLSGKFTQSSRLLNNEFDYKTSFQSSNLIKSKKVASSSVLVLIPCGTNKILSESDNTDDSKCSK